MPHETINNILYMTENNKFKIGDDFDLMTLDYSEWFNENIYTNDEYQGKKYHKSTIKYVTPTNGLILEIKDDLLFCFDLDTSLFKGSEIKEVYNDFEGDDDTMYCVLYEENSPFY